jgi:hypothetical protein
MQRQALSRTEMLPFALAALFLMLLLASLGCLAALVLTYLMASVFSSRDLPSDTSQRWPCVQPGGHADLQAENAFLRVGRGVVVGGSTGRWVSPLQPHQRHLSVCAIVLFGAAD